MEEEKYFDDDFQMEQEIDYIMQHIEQTAYLIQDYDFKTSEDIIYVTKEIGGTLPIFMSIVLIGLISSQRSKQNVLVFGKFLKYFDEEYLLNTFLNCSDLRNPILIIYVYFNAAYMVKKYDEKLAKILFSTAKRIVDVCEIDDADDYMDLFDEKFRILVKRFNK